MSFLTRRREKEKISNLSNQQILGKLDLDLLRASICIFCNDTYLNIQQETGTLVFLKELRKYVTESSDTTRHFNYTAFLYILKLSINSATLSDSDILWLFINACSKTNLTVEGVLTNQDTRLIFFDHADICLSKLSAKHEVKESNQTEQSIETKSLDITLDDITSLTQEDILAMTMEIVKKLPSNFTAQYQSYIEAVKAYIHRGGIK